MKKIIKYVSDKNLNQYYSGLISESTLVMASYKEKEYYRFIPEVIARWINIPNKPIIILIPEENEFKYKREKDYLTYEKINKEYGMK